MEISNWNFSWVTPDLAVGGRFPCEHSERLRREHGIGAVVDLRLEDRDDEVELGRCGILFLHLPTEDMNGVSLPKLEEGVEFVRARRAAGQRVLVHCEHGIGRSALLVLCVLVDRGMAPLDALERLKQARGIVSPSPAQFEKWIAWLERHRQQRARTALAETGEGREPAWQLPSFDSFASIAYRHLRRR